MIDNTHVVVLRGTGTDMVPVPEMAAFAERYGFEFHAHKIGDANRSGRVERPFTFIREELSGRTGVCRLERPQPTGARLVRPGQPHLQKAHPCDPQRVVCRRAPASEAFARSGCPRFIACIIASSMSKGTWRYIPTATRCRWIGSGARWRSGKPRIGSKSSADSGQSVCHERVIDPIGQEDHAAGASPGARPGDQENRSPSGGEDARPGGSRDRRLRRRLEETRPKIHHSCPAPTAAHGPGVSPRGLPFGRGRSRALRALRPRPAGAHDPAPHRQRIFPARYQDN